MGGVKPVSGRGWKKKLYRHRKSSSAADKLLLRRPYLPAIFASPLLSILPLAFFLPFDDPFLPLLHRKSIRDFFGPRADQPCSRLTRVNIVGDSGEAPGLIRQIRKASRNKCLPRRYRWSGTRLVDTAATILGPDFKYGSPPSSRVESSLIESSEPDRFKKEKRRNEKSDTPIFSFRRLEFLQWAEF